MGDNLYYYEGIRLAINLALGVFIYLWAYNNGRNSR